MQASACAVALSLAALLLALAYQVAANGEDLIGHRTTVCHGSSCVDLR